MLSGFLDCRKLHDKLASYACDATTSRCDWRRSERSGGRHRPRQAGLQVDVFEAESQPGGGARTMELTLPGFRHDFGSAVHPMAVGSPFFTSHPCMTTVWNGYTRQRRWRIRSTTARR